MLADAVMLSCHEKSFHSRIPRYRFGHEKSFHAHIPRYPFRNNDKFNRNAVVANHTNSTNWRMYDCFPGMLDVWATWKLRLLVQDEGGFIGYMRIYICDKRMLHRPVHRKRPFAYICVYTQFGNLTVLQLVSQKTWFAMCRADKW